MRLRVGMRRVRIIVIAVVALAGPQGLTTPPAGAQVADMQVVYNGRLLGKVTVWLVSGTVVGAFNADTSLAADSSLAAAARLCGKHHFNWYQLVAWSDDSPVDVSRSPLDAPWFDPPYGGYGDDLSTGIDETVWGDHLPWLYDEGADPPAGTPGWVDGFSLADHTSDNSLTFISRPPRTAHRPIIAFKTWLVALGDDGRDPLWLPGFGWEWSGTEPARLKELCHPPRADEFDDMTVLGRIR